jgi:sugar phosphate isomerase/epimerase
VKFGVYSIVVPDYQAEEVAKMVADAGYTGIEWTVGYPRAVWDGKSEWHVSYTNLEADAKRASQIAKDHHLEIPSLGTSCASHDFEKMRRLMDAALVMNASMIRVASCGYNGKEDFNRLFSKVRKDYETVEKIAREKGVAAVIEIHMGTIAPSASGMRRLLEGFDPKHVCAMLDPGNMVHEGLENMQMCVEILGPYLRHVHAKNYGWYKMPDVFPPQWRPQPTALEDGIANFRLLLRALHRAGYKGYINLEDFRGGYCVKPIGITSQEKLAQAIAFFKSAMAEMKM